jgi:hypothetical protein
LDEVRAEGFTLLQQALPIMLRFMEDEYDDTCSTVFPMLQSVLASVFSSPYSHLLPTDMQVVQTEPKTFDRASR